MFDKPLLHSSLEGQRERSGKWNQDTFDIFQRQPRSCLYDIEDLFQNFEMINCSKHTPNIFGTRPYNTFAVFINFIDQFQRINPNVLTRQ